MKDIVKIALGVLLAVAICLAIALPIKAYFTPSAYEKCIITYGAENSLPATFFSVADEYVEFMLAVEKEGLEECKDAWGLHDEFHRLMGITYR